MFKNIKYISFFSVIIFFALFGTSNLFALALYSCESEKELTLPFGGYTIPVVNLVIKDFRETVDEETGLKQGSATALFMFASENTVLPLDTVFNEIKHGESVYKTFIHNEPREEKNVFILNFGDETTDSKTFKANLFLNGDGEIEYFAGVRVKLLNQLVKTFTSALAGDEEKAKSLAEELAGEEADEIELVCEKKVQ